MIAFNIKPLLAKMCDQQVAFHYIQGPYSSKYDSIRMRPKYGYISRVPIQPDVLGAAHTNLSILSVVFQLEIVPNRNKLGLVSNCCDDHCRLNDCNDEDTKGRASILT